MREISQNLTEVEGAVLTEIGHRGNCTAFRVRRAFELSPSASWRGSAGTVYQAVRRLTDRGLIHAQPLPGKRGGNDLTLTEEGAARLGDWMLDLKRACDVGFDPFRLRCGLWKKMPVAAQRDLIVELNGAIEAELALLRSYVAEQDPIEQAEVDLAIQLQEIRKKWLATFEASLA